MHGAKRILAAALVSLAVGAAATAMAAETSTDVDVASKELTSRIDELKGLMSKRPGDIDLMIELGNLYYENHMYDQAVNVYLEVTRIDSTHAGAHLNLGSVYADMGDPQKAEKELKAALKLAPDDAMVYTNLGTTYYSRQRYNDAVDMYKMALALDQDCMEAHFNLAVAFADAQVFDEAIREWERAIQLGPDTDIAEICRENIEMIKEFRGEK
jgi:tetratricopeptide (TPR) repeat protein